MDARSFDALAKAVSAPGSRRRLVAGLVAGALGLAGVRPADAVACRGDGAVCREHANCCFKVCSPPDAQHRRRCAAAPTTTTTTTTAPTSTTTSTTGTPTRTC